MNKKINYEYIDSKGFNRKLNIEFVITPFRAGDRFNPPEYGDIEIYSIMESGVEVEVSDSEIAEIDEFIKNKADEYDPYKNHNF
jgi:hypothetical protein